MTRTEITRYRLNQQQLVNPGLKHPEQVVGWMGAVQAQDYFGALWTIGQRMKKADEGVVEKALIERKIIRTWPMRGTLHFVVPADVRWMLKYLTPRIISRSASLYRKAGIDGKVLTKSKKLLIKGLEGGKQLTRDEMYGILEKSKISTADSRGLHIIGHLAQEGLICFGARKGKQQTFALLDEWIPSYPMLKKDEALAELAVRYFTSHGPALIEDFMWWGGVTKADAMIGLELAKTRLAEEVINGKRYWHAGTTAAEKSNPSTAYLLPTYDEYGIAYKDRTEIIDPADHKKLGGTFISGIMMNGKMVGAWRRTLQNDKVLLETKPFAKSFTPSQDSAIRGAAERYSKFLGLSLEFTLRKQNTGLF
jgi:hypothetical protein